jgi:hypothetical protein
MELLSPAVLDPGRSPVAACPMGVDIFAAPLPARAMTWAWPRKGRVDRIRFIRDQNPLLTLLRMVGCGQGMGGARGWLTGQGSEQALHPPTRR